MSRRKNGHSPRKNRNSPPSKQGSARWRRRRVLGQNFLRDVRDAERIVATSDVEPDDLVVEFGPGSGMLTAPLARHAKQVIAVEYDPHFAGLLRHRFDGSGVKVINTDARRFRLPRSRFKVVSNVPFGITTDLLDHLLKDPAYGPVSGSLLMQDDVARKHARNSPTSLKTLSWSPFYEFSAGLWLPSDAFHPRPKVNARILKLHKRKNPLLAPGKKRDFEAFVRNAFKFGTPNGVGVPLGKEFPKKRLRSLAREARFSLDDAPSRLSVEQWVEVFSALPQ